MAHYVTTVTAEAKDDFSYDFKCCKCGKESGKKFCKVTTTTETTYNGTNSEQYKNMENDKVRNN